MRPTLPARDPKTPGYVLANELPDGSKAPADADGNFILGPTHNPAPETSEQSGVPTGSIFTFTMQSIDSKIYAGITREPNTYSSADPKDPARNDCYHQPSRTLRSSGYGVRPQAICRRNSCTLIVSADGPDRV